MAARFEAIGPGVRRLRDHVDAPAWSPDERYVAFWRSRTASADLVARERVYCVEAATGREVFALDGPEIVRAVGFGSDEVLLVQRDSDAGARLTAHAVPDGGVVAECVLPRGGGVETRLSTSADGRVVLSSPVWRIGPRSYAHAYVLVGRELRTACAIDPAALGTGREGQNPSTTALDNDGARVAVAFYAGEARASSVVVVVASDGTRVALGEVRHADYATSIAWLGPDRLLACGANSPSTLTAFELRGAKPYVPASAQVVGPPRTGAQYPLGGFAVSPERERVAVAFSDPSRRSNWRLMITSLDEPAARSAPAPVKLPIGVAWPAPVLEWSRDGAAVFVYTPGAEGADVLRVDAASLVFEQRTIAVAPPVNPNARTPRIQRLGRGSLELIVPAADGSGILVLLDEGAPFA